ncbi:hypothetical protein ACFOD9_02575 [Novosphingobium bradum]|uniref:Uncharacterized protein n=1 Tax=Novosphingobium bradum TaxID=1737444 RepID=A0ABV7IK93_9SPHN
MSIHFAASRRPARSGLARCLSRPAWVAAHNDNGADETAARIDTPLLRATLEHFAAHGLAAAGQAYDKANAALAAGDAAGQHHWMAVCRMLDRRLPARRRR